MWTAFISHASADNKFVKALVVDLAQNGIVSWYDEKMIGPGASFVDALDL